MPGRVGSPIRGTTGREQLDTVGQHRRQRRLVHDRVPLLVRDCLMRGGSSRIEPWKASADGFTDVVIHGAARLVSPWRGGWPGSPSALLCFTVEMRMPWHLGSSTLENLTLSYMYMPWFGLRTNLTVTGG